MIEFQDFEKVDIRVGKIVKVEDFPKARKPSYIMSIDFGEKIGVKKSAGQYPQNYSKNELIGKLVLGLTNLPPLKMGNFKSEVLILGVPNKNKNAILVTPDKTVTIGGKLY